MHYNCFFAQFVGMHDLDLKYSINQYKLLLFLTEMEFCGLLDQAYTKCSSIKLAI